MFMFVIISINIYETVFDNKFYWSQIVWLSMSYIFLFGVFLVLDE